MPIERTAITSNLLDVLDRVLDKGIVIDAWVRLSRVGIELVTHGVEKALARLAKRQRGHIDRRAQVERELAQVQQRLDRLLDALADGAPSQQTRSKRA